MVENNRAGLSGRDCLLREGRGVQKREKSVSDPN